MRIKIGCDRLNLVCDLIWIKLLQAKIHRISYYFFSVLLHYVRGLETLMTQASSILWSILTGTLLVGLLLVTLLYFDLQVPLREFFDWLQTIGLWAPLLFILIDMLLVIFLLPSIIFTLAAGFLFGPALGSFCVIVATTLGAAVAFFISRHSFSEGVKNYLRNHKKLKVVNDELVHEGWKLILLTRLVPFFPLKLSNYFFGATNFSMADFVIGTFIGIIPNTLFIVYMGSLAADLSMLVSGELMRSPNAWGFYVLAFSFMLVTVTYVTKHAQRALLRYEAQAVKDVRRKHAS
ncbi:MAG: putative membrane protein YdjX (TVP38/TMEM64 family) [Paraglaciecola sp.]|jgi:uncharacterized membrane protein YdjX (TVP38/TMEM64 family)